jgi:hypothetical protein
MSVVVPISIGELWDKYTILLIKQEKIKDEDKIKYVTKEITDLDVYITEQNKESGHFIDLKHINELLWDIEDRIRVKEIERQFDTEFIELARSVYYTNDKRAEIKKQINILYNSNIHEVKEYVNYTTTESTNCSKV